MTVRTSDGFSRYDTQTLWQQDHDHFVHPWTDFDSFKKEGSLVIVESEGAYVYDSEGKQYLDGIGGLWCVNIGYGDREMEQAIAEQVRRLPYFNTFVDTTNAPAARLAAKLAQLAPACLNHVVFTTGGSMSNEAAIRMIQYYNNRRGKPKKKHIISRRDAYHGSTYLTMSMSGKRADRIGFDYLSGFIHHISSPNCYRRPSGMSLEAFCDFLVEELESKILEIGPENVACFIAEPILGAGGVIVPPDGYHRRTRELCRKYDVLYISDEVVTAFGRLGHMFASKDMFGIEPDVICCAKGISSGYVPLGAMIFCDAIYDVISAPGAEGLFSTGFTYSGHPVSCAAGLKNIEILEREQICQHVQAVGPYFEERLRTLGDLPIVGDVRGRRFMMCVEFVADRETKALFDKEPYSPGSWSDNDTGYAAPGWVKQGVNIGKRISNQCEERGLIVRPMGHLNVLSPPLIMNREQIDFTVEVLRESIEATMAELIRERLWVG